MKTNLFTSKNGLKLTASQKRAAAVYMSNLLYLMYENPNQVTTFKELIDSCDEGSMNAADREKLTFNEFKEEKIILAIELEIILNNLPENVSQEIESDFGKANPHLAKALKHASLDESALCKNWGVRVHFDNNGNFISTITAILVDLRTNEETKTTPYSFSQNAGDYLSKVSDDIINELNQSHELSHRL